MLVLMVVGLSILTFGATSASFFGFDFGCPIFKLVDVESSKSGRNLRVCCLGGVVVRRRSSWHLLLVGSVLLLLWCLFLAHVVTGLRICVCRLTERYVVLWEIDGFQETSSPYVGVPILCTDNV